MNQPFAPTINSVEEAIRKRIGLDPRSVGPEGFRRAVRRRMAERAIDREDRYLFLVMSDAEEFYDLVEELLVPETWFFRDRAPYLCLREFVARRQASNRLAGPFRVLSVPCSTGEEPYSIAMTLLDAGMSPKQIAVEGADLSRRVLAKAAEGVYGKNSFRGDEAAFPGLYERFFASTGPELRLDPQVKKLVSFTRGNLASADLLPGQARYHAIFCRNVLIYLDAAARQIALANLHRLVLSDGLLYVGHVEAPVVAGPLFVRYDDRYHCAFKPSGPADGNLPDAVGRLPRPKKPPRWFAGSRAQVPTAQQPTSPVSVPPAPTAAAVREATQEEPPAGLLARARTFADAGRLAEAAALCGEVLAEQPGSADACCLLGLVWKARQDLSRAEGCFRKTLYLDPKHVEALVHMTLLAEQRGDVAAAANYRRRAEQAGKAGG